MPATTPKSAKSTASKKSISGVTDDSVFTFNNTAPAVIPRGGAPPTPNTTPALPGAGEEEVEAN